MIREYWRLESHTWSCWDHGWVFFIHHPIHPQCNSMAYAGFYKLNLFAGNTNIAFIRVICTTNASANCVCKLLNLQLTYLGFPRTWTHDGLGEVELHDYKILAKFLKIVQENKQFLHSQICQYINLRTSVYLCLSTLPDKEGQTRTVFTRR